MLNCRITKKRNLIPLFLCLIVSCSNLSYKSDIKNRTEDLMLQLQSGNLDNLPGYNDYKDSLKEEDLNKIKETFSSISEMNVTVNSKKNNIVSVFVDVLMNEQKSRLVFQYKLDNKDWILQKEMNIQRSYDLVEE